VAQRLSGRVGLGIVVALVCIASALVLVRRSESESEGVDEGAPTADAVARISDTSEQGDPLLADARARIEGGQLPEDVVAALLASDSPEHRRARRLLEAMRDPVEAEEDGDDDSAVGVTPIVPPKIDSETTGSVAPVPAPAPEASPTDTRAAVSKASSRRSTDRASLSGISLREHGRGATLTLHASGGIVAGVANQPRSGIVRLVVESRGASTKALSARPRVTGARVTSVAAGTDTVIVTVELDPGWSLGNIERTSSGARIHLRRPG
jgi:hypothetical protein